MGVDEKTEIDFRTIIKNMGMEIQKIHEKINNLKKALPKDHGSSDGCLVMVMQLEAFTIFITKLFDSGLFDKITLEDHAYLFKKPKEES